MAGYRTACVCFYNFVEIIKLLYYLSYIVNNSLVTGRMCDEYALCAYIVPPLEPLGDILFDTYIKLSAVLFADAHLTVLYLYARPE